MSILVTIGKLLLIFIAIFGIAAFFANLKDPNKTYTVYLHEDTLGFGFTKFDFDSETIVKHSYEGVVFRPYFRYIGEDNDSRIYQFFFKIFSKEKKYIIINNITIGNKFLKIDEKIYIVGVMKEKFLSTFPTKSIFYSAQTPHSIKVSDQDLATFVNNEGDIEAKVLVTIDNQVKSLVFKIKPTEKKDTYFHLW